MPFTDYPNGLTSFGIPMLGGGTPPATIPTSSGKYRFVCSLGGVSGSGDGSSMDQPLATVFGTGGAYAQCVAAKGDVIVCLPGHTETLTAATAAASSGVSVVGLGWGSLRPTFTITTANTGTVTVSADNQSWTNCLVVANFLSIAAAFTLTTAKNFGLYYCGFSDTDASHDFLNIVKSTGGANTVDGLTLIGNVWNGTGVTSVNSFLLSANAIKDLTLLGNFVRTLKIADTSILATITTGILTNLNCGYNRVYSSQTATTAGSLIDLSGTTSSGFVYNNYAQTLTTSSDKLFTTTTGLSAFNNYVTGVVGASGFLIPAVDS